MVPNRKAAPVFDAPQAAHKETDAPDFIASDGEIKALATLRAKLALRGYAVHGSSVGGFLVCRWGLTRHCTGVEELRAFLRLIGGAA